jgi:hypothetical protein
MELSLREKGYAIVPQVITAEELDWATHLFYYWTGELECQYPGIEEIHSKIDPHGIFKHHQAGHTAHAWYLRTRPGVRSIYEEIYKDKDLIVSYDGCCWITRENYKNKKDSIWTHTDQAACDSSFQCLQGFVSLTNNKHTSLVVYEGSHLLHESYFRERGDNSKTNWNKIDPEYLKNIQDRKRVLDVKAGDLVLWDSRTFHQNQYGGRDCEDRIVQYVCYLPRKHKSNTKANQLKRKLYWEQKRTTTHWPCPVRVNGLQPRTFGDDGLKIDYSLCPEQDYSGFGSEILKLV